MFIGMIGLQFLSQDIAWEMISDLELNNFVNRIILSKGSELSLKRQVCKTLNLLQRSGNLQ